MLPVSLFLQPGTVLGTEGLCSNVCGRDLECSCANTQAEACLAFGRCVLSSDNWQLRLLGSKSTQLKTEHHFLILLHFFFSIELQGHTCFVMLLGVSDCELLPAVGLSSSRLTVYSPHFSGGRDYYNYIFAYQENC